MKNLTSKKLIASKVLHVGKNKVWLDPDRLAEIKEAITKQDIADLIKDGAIKKQPSSGSKRRAGKVRLKRKMKGRRRNEGKIKFKNTKQNYPQQIRKLRALLKIFKNNNQITKEQYSKLRLSVKAGTIRNKQTLIEKIKIK